MVTKVTKGTRLRLPIKVTASFSFKPRLTLTLVLKLVSFALHIVKIINRHQFQLYGTL